jgi:TonB family protein
MDLSLGLDDLAAYSYQIAVLVAAGTLLQYIFRLRMPAILLRYWQVLLIACLLLPALQPWRIIVVGSARIVGLPVFPITTLVGQPNARSTPFPIYSTVALVLVMGITLRLLWLLVGLFRLSFYRRNSRLIAGLPEAVKEMRLYVGVQPEIYISTEISGPVTFGLGRSAVLFPDSFLEMDPKLQRPIACHEFLHVRRRDWLFVVLEDILRSLFWFHPAIWWAVSRIQLHREQTVDREVLNITGERKPYLESLLHIASTRNRLAAVPAPLFLKECHLAQRVALMVKEVAMSKTRVFVSLSAAILLLLCTGRLATGWFPLQAPGISKEGAQQATHVVANPMREPIRVGGNVQETKLIYRAEPVYPEMAKKSRVSGNVILQVTTNEAGEVYEVRVMRGHPLLNDAAIDAVRQWRYSPTLLNGEPVPVIATVTVIFRLGDSGSGMFVTLDEVGNLRTPSNQLEGPALIQKMREANGTITIMPSPGASMPVVEAAVKALQSEGLQNLRVAGFEVWEGRMFSLARSARVGETVAVWKGPDGEEHRVTSASAPVLALDDKLLAGIAKSSGRVDNLPPEQRPLLYKLYMNEVGEIVGIQQVRGPKIPAVENELMRTRIISPGRRGADPVPVVFLVEVAVP